MTDDANRAFTAMLVLMAQHGDRDALERLAAHWRPRHYAHARRLLGHADGAGDVVQDAWANIVHGLGRLREPERFPAWSYAIVTRRCQDTMRKKGREPPGDPDADPPDPVTSEADQKSELRRALAVLPPDQRAAIALFYLDGFLISEIAEALGAPEGTVKTRLFHARRTLRRQLEGDES